MNHYSSFSEGKIVNPEKGLKKLSKKYESNRKTTLPRKADRSLLLSPLHPVNN